MAPPGEPSIDPKTLGHMLALFAHDLRNPLSALLTNLDYLQTADTIAHDSGLLAAAEDCTVACDTLRRLTANLDVISQKLIGGTTLRLRRVLVHELAQDCISRFQTMAQLQGVHLALRIETTGTEALVDMDLVTRILDNLLSNALSFAPSNSTVHLTDRTNALGQGIIGVHDMGPAVDAHLSDEIFTADGQVRAHQFPHSRYGRGLGLFVARTAADAMGAQLRLGTSASGCLLELELPPVS